MAWVAAAAVCTATPFAHAEDGAGQRLCQADANGDWSCSEQGPPATRERHGAPVPAVDTRLPVQEQAPAQRPLPAVRMTRPDPFTQRLPVVQPPTPSRAQAAANPAEAPGTAPAATGAMVPAYTTGGADADSSGADPNAPARPRIRILSQPRTAWALQLIATASRDALESVAETYQLFDHPAVRLAAGNSVRYALIWDVYPDRASAEAALAALPDVLKEMKPWVRPIGPLQDAMNRATRISPPPARPQP